MAQDVTEREAARGGSRNGLELCQLEGSSCPPGKKEMERINTAGNIKSIYSQ